MAQATNFVGRLNIKLTDEQTDPTQILVRVESEDPTLDGNVGYISFEDLVALIEAEVVTGDLQAVLAAGSEASIENPLIITYGADADLSQIVLDDGLARLQAGSNILTITEEAASLGSNLTIAPSENPEDAVQRQEVETLMDDLYQVTVIPEMFGAVGDGVVDDWAAIQEAVNSDYKAVLLGRDYIVSRPVVLPSDKIIILRGTVKMQDGFVSDLMADFASGANTIQVSGADTKYFAGQQVCVSDNVKGLQGGGTGQTRRVALAFTIDSVVGDVITFTNTSNQSFLVSDSAKVGHCQSVFLADGSSDVVIMGDGVIDQNKQHQYDIEPVTSTGTYTEDVRYGCAVSFLNGARINISGITAKNSVLHNFQFKYVTDFNIDRVVADAAHDKGLLMWFCSRFNITNSRFLNSDWEDGLICHNNCDNGFISNIYTENCSRTGIYISNTNNNIVISGVVAKDCGRAFQTQNSYNIRVLGFKAIGGGVERYLTTARPIYTLTNVKNSEFDFGVYGSTTAGSGISIVGSTENVKITGNIMDMLTSTGNGIGILIGAASGNSPKNIDLSGVSILNCKTGLKVDTGSLNIRFTNGTLAGNTTAVTSTAGTELKMLNVSGSTENDLNGILTLREENASGVAADFIQEAHGGQPSHSTSRALGTVVSPAAIPVSSGIFRMRARGYNGSAFSNFFQWLSLIATENWTTGGNGYKIGLRTNKAGTTSAGISIELYENGISLGETFTALSPANFNARAQTGQTLPLYRAVRENGTEFFKLNPDGTMTLGAIPSIEAALGSKQDSISGTGYAYWNGTTITWVTGAADRIIRADGSTALFLTLAQNNPIGTNTGTGAVLTTTTGNSKALWDLQMQITANNNGVRRGASLLSGTGAATAFTIPHGMGVTPTFADVVAKNSASAGISFITWDATNITFNYSVAPASGTNNLSVAWTAMT